MPSHTAIVNKFVLNFLRSRKVSPDVVDAWEDKALQSNLKKTIKKQRIVHPRGIINPYIWFCKEERAAILAENPQITMKQLACKTGPLWVALKQSEKPEDVARVKGYIEKYQEERRRYNEEKNVMEPPRIKKEQSIDTPYKAFCYFERKSGNKATIVELNRQWKTVRKNPELFEKFKQLARKT